MRGLTAEEAEVLAKYVRLGSGCSGDHAVRGEARPATVDVCGRLVASGRMRWEPCSVQRAWHARVTAAGLEALRIYEALRAREAV